MRDLIRKAQTLFEMPYRVSGRIDFGLGNVENNRFIAQGLLDQQSDVIKETDDYLLGRAGTSTKGEIFLYNKTRDLLDYFVSYESIDRPILGRTVTQVKVWRSDEPIIVDITRMVFDYFLRNYDGVVSDMAQTEDGERFWITRLYDAFNRGLKVGLRDENGNDHIYNQKEITIRQWADSLNAWGTDREHYERRFFILAR